MKMTQAGATALKERLLGSFFCAKNLKSQSFQLMDVSQKAPSEHRAAKIFLYFQVLMLQFTPIWCCS